MIPVQLLCSRKTASQGLLSFPVGLSWTLRTRRRPRQSHFTLSTQYISNTSSVPGTAPGTGSKDMGMDPSCWQCKSLAGILTRTCWAINQSRKRWVSALKRKLMGNQHFPVWLTQSQHPKEPVISDTETGPGPGYLWGAGRRLGVPLVPGAHLAWAGPGECVISVRTRLLWLWPQWLLRFCLCFPSWWTINSTPSRNTRKRLLLLSEKRMHHPVKHPIPSTNRKGVNIWHCPLESFGPPQGEEQTAKTEVRFCPQRLNGCSLWILWPTWSLSANSQDP